MNQNFVVKGGTASSLSSWQTTSSANMTAGQDYPVANGSFTASLAAQSITTFVGSVSGTNPAGGGTSTGGASGIGGNKQFGG